MAGDTHGDEALTASLERWLVDGEPQWDAIDFELPCSRCGYELRMLTVPRCPECGLQFEWREILEARLRQSTFLFEYHWRKRPVRSYVETVWRGLRPWRFWKEVSIHEQIRPGPLVFMFLSAPLVFVLVAHGMAAILWLLCTGVLYMAPALSVPPGTLLTAIGEVQWTADSVALLPVRMGLMYLVVPVILVLIHGASAVLLCSLRQTLGRCRVRSAQVFRVAAYAAAPVFTLWALLTNAHAMAETLGLMPLELGSVAAALALESVPIALLGVYLAVGLRRYLRLPRPWLLGMSAALVGMLFAQTASILLIGP